MEIVVYRYSSQSRTTTSAIHIDGEFQCFGLEDRYREVKVYGDTRIPSGKYRVTLRTVGSTHERYKKKFPDFHIGTLWVRDVPNFEFILIHLGNSGDDTAGCLLVGDHVTNNKLEMGLLSNSTDAYVEFYKKVSFALSIGEGVSIEYIDL
tara:strand:- start:497 stop:946 length:450 start_codon:yes stop_codon:yes gene_type:complete